MAKRKNTAVQLNDFFASVVSNLPRFATFEKVFEEFEEHKDFAKWVFVRVVVPIIIFNLILNFFIFERFRLAPSIFGVVVFFYAAFVVDLDSFFVRKKGSWLASKSQRVVVLFLAPVVIYYVLSKKMKPIRLPPKYFHSYKTMILFVVFLYFLGFLIFFTWWDAFFFAFFGACGYITHLVADKVAFRKK